jgi:hypothetical protein
MLLRIFSFLVFICFFVPVSWLRNWFGFSRFSERNHQSASAWDLNREAVPHKGKNEDSSS